MSHPEPLSSRAAQLLAQVTLASLRRAEQLVARKARALDEALQHHAHLIVNVVDDPKGTMQLIGVRGPLTLETVGTLAEALFAVRDGLALHLDVSDATIGGPAVVEQVEQTGRPTRAAAGPDPHRRARSAPPGAQLPPSPLTHRAWSGRRRVTVTPLVHDGDMSEEHIPQQLSLLPPVEVPVQFRIDEATRRRGMRHIAEIRALLAERHTQRTAGTVGVAVERHQTAA